MSLPLLRRVPTIIHEANAYPGLANRLVARWVTTVAVFLQTVFNMEAVRYTLATGEPAFTGFMRTRPSAKAWALFYAALYFLQAGWPAFATDDAVRLTRAYRSNLTALALVALVDRRTYGSAIPASWVALWLILAVLILGMLVRRIVGRFESMDVSRLSKLKG